jgi:hypothetical protein
MKKNFVLKTVGLKAKAVTQRNSTYENRMNVSYFTIFTGFQRMNWLSHILLK